MTNDNLPNLEEDEGEDLLSRWSRRKAEARQPPAAVEQPTASEPLPPGDEEMPPVESLNADSDYSPFLSPRVSEELQRLALRKLFRTPSFNLRDGLDDYDEDFSTFVSLGEVVTAEMRRRLRIAAERLASTDEDATAPHLQAELETAGAGDPRLDPTVTPDVAGNADDREDDEVRS